MDRHFCLSAMIFFMGLVTTAASAAQVYDDWQVLSAGQQGSLSTWDLGVDPDYFDQVATLYAPGAVDDVVDGQDVGATVGTPVNFSLTYETAGFYGVRVEGEYKDEEGCLDAPFGPCPYDPAKTYEAEGQLAVAPADFGAVDRIIAAAAGEQIGYRPSLNDFGILTDPDDALVGAPMFSWIINGITTELPISFDTPGWHLLDWSGSTVMADVKYFTSDCGDIFILRCQKVETRSAELSGLFYAVYVSEPSPVPLPASVCLLMVGMLSLRCAARRELRTA